MDCEDQSLHFNIRYRDKKTGQVVSLADIYLAQIYEYRGLDSADVAVPIFYVSHFETYVPRVGFGIELLKILISIARELEYKEIFLMPPDFAVQIIEKNGLGTNVSFEDAEYVRGDSEQDNKYTSYYLVNDRLIWRKKRLVKKLVISDDGIGSVSGKMMRDDVFETEDFTILNETILNGSRFELSDFSLLSTLCSDMSSGLHPLKSGEKIVSTYVAFSQGSLSILPENDSIELILVGEDSSGNKFKLASWILSAIYEYDYAENADNDISRKKDSYKLRLDYWQVRRDIGLDAIGLFDVFFNDLKKLGFDSVYFDADPLILEVIMALKECYKAGKINGFGFKAESKKCMEMKDQTGSSFRRFFMPSNKILRELYRDEAVNVKCFNINELDISGLKGDSIQGRSDQALYVFINCDVVTRESAVDFNYVNVSLLNQYANIIPVFYSEVRTCKEIKTHILRQNISALPGQHFFGKEDMAHKKDDETFYEYMLRAFLLDSKRKIALIDAQDNGGISNFAEYVLRQFGKVGLINLNISTRNVDNFLKLLHAPNPQVPVTIMEHLQQITESYAAQGNKVSSGGELFGATVIIKDEQTRHNLLSMLDKVTRNQMLEQAA